MAAPVIPSESTIRSRNSGLLPLGVIFDATGTTGGTDPIHNLLYLWNFGDSASGTWDYGCNTSSSKNFAVGPVAAHVYERADTYTWTLVVINSAGEASTTTGTITVSDWANDANTICVGNVLPVAGVNGVPSSATCVASSDFDSVMGTYLTSGTTKRIMFQRGDTFSCSFQAEPTTTGGVYIGAFGTGAAPIISITGDCPAISLLASDYRILDLYIDGNSGASSRGVQVANAAGTLSQITVLNNTITRVQHGFICRDRTANLEDQVFVVGNVISETTNVCCYPQTATQFAMLGNSLSAKTGATGVHVFRSGQIKVGVLSNNTLSKASSSCHNIKLHAPDWGTLNDYTEKVVIRQNQIVGGSNGQLVKFEPQNAGVDERLRNVIFEANYIYCGAVGDTIVSFTGSKMTGRNNILNFTDGNTGTNSSFVMGKLGAEPESDQIWLYNNTMYQPQAGTLLRMLNIRNSPTNSSFVNNLAYSPLVTTAEVSNGTAGAGYTASNNSTSLQMKNTDPQFTGTLTSPIGFTVAAASYAADGGTAAFPSQQSDFYVGLDKSAENRIGALVQSGQAQRKNVAA